MNKKKIVCDHPWSSVWVKANGDVTLCPQNRTVIGNINKEELKDVWNSKNAIKVRKYFKESKYIESGCEVECPFLRGKKTPPSKLPPHEEMNYPDYPKLDYSGDYKNNFKKFKKNFNDQKTKIDNFPINYDIQAVLRCNFDCFMCGQDHSSKLEHDLKIQKQIEAFQNYAHIFRWQGGEVFLKKNFFEYSKNLKTDKNPYLIKFFITNGSVLNEKKLYEMCEKNNNVHFLVSIDGFTESTYRKIRRTNHFNKAINTVKTLANIQRKQNRKKLVKWNFTLMRSNVFEMIPAMKFCEDEKIDINFAPLQGNFKDENFFSFKKNGDETLYREIGKAKKLLKNFKIKVSGFEGIEYRLNQNF